MNRKRKAENSWECECRNAIEAGDADTVRKIEKKLQTLQNEAQARLIKLKQVTGMGVRIIDSNESQDGDVAYNTYERMIDAKFTAGPNAAKFSIWIRNVNREDTEELTVSSDLFYYESEKFRGDDDDDILKFLQKAGLEDARPEDYENYVADENCDDENERRRFVYAEVIADAICCIYEKYGEEDNMGVSLGISPSNIYTWMGCY